MFLLLWARPMMSQLIEQKAKSRDACDSFLRFLHDNASFPPSSLLFPSCLRGSEPVLN